MAEPPRDDPIAALDGAARAVFARKTYALLGLAAGCGEAALKKAYKKASLLYHPDKQRGKNEKEREVAANMFIKIKEAYELLGDEPTRTALDAAVERRAGTAPSRRATRLPDR